MSPIDDDTPTPGALCPVPITQRDRIVLGHGGGGRLTRELVEGIFLPAFHNALLDPLHDGALLDAPAGRLAFTTDAFVVQPLQFPGGDIGSLATYGTVNDLAMCGARPLALAASFILEEGLAMDTLRQVVASMARAAASVPVPIATGDTKVVERGKGDGIFITTTGLGVVPPGVEIAPRRAAPGDVVLLSGPIGAHGVAVMSVREGIAFETELRSDAAPLHGVVAALIDAIGPDVHVLRDPTRGGVATALNEIATAAGVEILLDEWALPVPDAVRGACELLGLDPLYVANEGCFIAIVAAARAGEALQAMRRCPGGRGAAPIGVVADDHPGTVTLRFEFGGARVVDLLSGEQLPRIC